MKALIYEGPERVAVRDVPVPELKDGQARIHVLYCGICGSDIGIYSGKHPRAKAPLVLGHEFIGVIDEIKGEAHGLKTGDCVAPYPLVSCGSCFACRNGMSHVCETLGIIGIDLDGGIAEYVNCDTDVLFPIDPKASMVAAGTIEPLAVAVHTLHRAGFKPLDSAAVLGAGPIGVLVALMLKHCGADKIVVSDFDEARLALCREMGFDAVNVKETDLEQYVKQASGGDGMDLVIECTGAESAALQTTKLCRIGGMICIAGVHKALHPVSLQDMHFRELSMTATRVYTKREFGQAVKYAQVIAPELEKTVTHILPLSSCDHVFELIADPKEAAVKVLIDCRG